MKPSADWYVEAFQDLYPALYPHRDEAAADREVAELAGWLGWSGRERVLDACCGGGRHLAAMRSRGFDAWGIDLSPPLLARACARSGLAGRAVRADVRRLPFGEVFDAVVNLFTSFGYFLSEEENLAGLREWTRVLRPGGILLIDHMNRPALEKTLVPESRDRRGDLEVVQKRRIEGDRVVKEIEVFGPDGSVRRFQENVRLYRQEEFLELGRALGWERILFAGSFDGAALGEDSPRMIVRAEKPRR
jgi:SAM-dependent methyltransferase